MLHYIYHFCAVSQSNCLTCLMAHCLTYLIVPLLTLPLIHFFDPCLAVFPPYYPQPDCPVASLPHRITAIPSQCLTDPCLTALPTNCLLSHASLRHHIVLLPHWLTASQAYCLTALLPHCLNVPQPNCPDASVFHCPKPTVHCLTILTPHCYTA